jgi:hypothetical protein
LQQVYFEDLAEREKIARYLNEPSPLVDYLDDELKGLNGFKNGLTSYEKQPKNNNNKQKQQQQNKIDKNGRTFNPDQFPSLPQPASKNGPIFAACNNSAAGGNNRGWEQTTKTPLF